MKLRKLCSDSGSKRFLTLAPLQAVGRDRGSDDGCSAPGARINPKTGCDSPREFLFAKPPSPPSLAEDIGGA